MLIHGEKWACEACVRGHRVSNCQHNDRPLQHINKKGRPVSQCAHCRAMRKSRSSHIKCDCGEKTSKCAHLQPAMEGHTETCCCNHGGKCSCCGKKEGALDTVPEADAESESERRMRTVNKPKPAPRRRRANTIHSDVLSFDANGNRKPASTSKPARAHHKVGPYQLNRVNSDNSTTSLSGSLDSFAENRQNLTNQRRVKSEATSPQLSNPGFHMSGAVPPLDLSGLEYSSYVPSANNSSFDLFGSGFSPDHDQPLYSAGLDASVDWSLYDIPSQNFGPSSYNQTGSQGFNNFTDFGSNSEQLPNLVNTTSNSGDVSEAEDFMPGADGHSLSQSYMSQNILGNALDISSIDYDSFYKNTDANPNPLADTGMSMVEDDPAFWVPNYQDGVVDESPDPLSTQAAGNFWEM